MSDAPKPSKQEGIKEESQYLRGKIAEELADKTTEFVSEESYELLKFHGSYQGYNRDTATERKKQGLDKEYEFMLRLRIPAGRMTAEQYLAMDGIADTLFNGTLRITTRETFQFHCIIKEHLKPLIQEINKALMTTLGGCGDVVRNVMACPAPIKDKIHDRLEQDAYAVVDHLAPKTKAYHEIWLDGEKVESSQQEEIEPIYGKFYLPRKFKIGLSTPEDNCIDVLTHDLAIISLFDEEGDIKGYNIAIGGGLGMQHNNKKTYPRLATPVMYVKPEGLLPASEAVVKLHRDHGDRGNRRHARLKYVVEENGIAWARNELERYMGHRLEDPWATGAYEVENHLGWHPQGDGKWFLGVPVSSGRIVDTETYQIRTALRKIIEDYKMPIRLTADQNIILCDIEEGEKPAIESILKKAGVLLREDLSPLAQHFLACVSLPTCGKALAEAERVKLPLQDDLEALLQKYDLLNDRISVRIAGCPNGCSRPYVGDIGIVGRTPGNYAIFIGGDFEGTRLNEKIFDKVPLEQLPAALEPFLARYASERQGAEGFGDFCHRVGVEGFASEVKQGLQEQYKWAQ